MTARPSGVEALRDAAEAIRDEDPGCKATHGCPWHGPTALATADWLTSVANRFEYGDCGGPDYAHALAIARSYLGDHNA